LNPFASRSISGLLSGLLCLSFLTKTFYAFFFCPQAVIRPA
jgi:hypothetical protein